MKTHFYEAERPEQSLPFDPKSLRSHLRVKCRKELAWPLIYKKGGIRKLRIDYSSDKITAFRITDCGGMASVRIYPMSGFDLFGTSNRHHGRIGR